MGLFSHCPQSSAFGNLQFKWQFHILLLSLQFIHPKSQLHGKLVIEGERA